VFIAAQVGGGIAGVLLIRLLYPALTPAQAAGALLPHESAGPGAAGGNGGRPTRLPSGPADTK
jgi:hypothetical protein